MLLTINIPIPQNIKQMNRKKKAAQKNKDLNLDFMREYLKVYSSVEIFSHIYKIVNYGSFLSNKLIHLPLFSKPYCNPFQLLTISFALSLKILLIPP